MNHKTLGDCKVLLDFRENKNGLDGKRFMLVESHLYYDGYEYIPENKYYKMHRYILWGNVEMDPENMSAIDCLREDYSRMSTSQAVRKFGRIIESREHITFKINEE